VHDTTPVDVDVRRDTNLALLGVGVAVMAWGASGAVIKAIDMDSLAVGFWRFLIYVVVLAGWMRFRGATLDLHTLTASAAGGVSLGLDVVFFFSAVKLTNVVNATTIGAMQPVIVAIVAARFFGERIRGRDIVAALVAIVAVIVVVIESSGTPEWSPRGDLLAVGAVFAWSGYFIFSKRSKGVLTSQQYTAGTGFWTASICLVAGIAFRQDMSPPAGSDWFLLLGLTLGAGILGHSIMNWSLVRIPLWLGSVLTLLIPVIGAVVAWIFLDEALSAVQIVAILVVVGALASIVLSQEQPEPVRAPQAPTRPSPAS
jgi:drug/metabolite transporter (DMT)-like permease